MKIKNSVRLKKNLLWIITVIFLILFSAICNASGKKVLIKRTGSIFKIIPTNLSPVIVPSTNSVDITYDVTNEVTIAVQNIIIDVGYNTSPNLLNIYIKNSTCTNSLPSGQQCSFEAILQGKGINGQTRLMPRVCAFGNSPCSVPAAAYRIAVTVLKDSGPKILQSISVTPPSETVAAGNAQQFIATGHYSDGSNTDISSSVRWTSSNTPTASVAPGGLATAISAGPDTITATDLNTYVAGNATLDVIGGLSTNTGVVTGGQTITLNGTFGTNPSITFDTNPATILSSSTSHITLKTPPNAYTGGSGGKMVNVVITSSTGSITLPNAYTYVGLNDPYEGGVIFHLNTSGNPGGSIVSSSDYPASNNPILSWDQANTYCAHYAGGGYSNWRLPNTYAYNTTPSNGVMSGEPSILYNNGAPYAGMSVSNDYWGSADTTMNPGSNNAWIENFGDGRQLSVTKAVTASYLFTRCVRDFDN